MPIKGPTVAIVQARLGSSRLPGKVLADLAGEPMLARVVDRARAARLVDEVVVATSDRPADDKIEAFCRERGIRCFRGSENDVLDRYAQAAAAASAATVVRITADCPLIDARIVDDVVAAYQTGDCDYATNTFIYTFPNGLDVEVFSRDALDVAARDARTATEREHVTPFIRTSGRFRLKNVENPRPRYSGHLRWTVDRPEDMQFVRAVYERLGKGGEPFWLDDILALLDREPELIDINSQFIRHEGYYRSVLAEPSVPPLSRPSNTSIALTRRAASLSLRLRHHPEGDAIPLLVRGQGGRAWDIDGNEYVDGAMGLGSVILGHGFPPVTTALERELHQGLATALSHPLMIDATGHLNALFPWAQAVRFAASGAAALHIAVEAACDFTGRNMIVYGRPSRPPGAASAFPGGVERASDMLSRTTLSFGEDNLADLEALLAERREKIAAVVTDPFASGKLTASHLAALHDLARHAGVLLIFDERRGGLRVARGGAQAYFGIAPDISCLGEAMANGFALGAAIGRAEIIEASGSESAGGSDEINVLSLAAATATLDFLRTRNVTGALWDIGLRLHDGYNYLAQQFGLDRYTSCRGLPPCTWTLFHDGAGNAAPLYFELFQQECLRRGVVFTGAHYASFSHTEADTDRTLRVYKSAMEVLAKAIVAGNVAQQLAALAADMSR